MMPVAIDLFCGAGGLAFGVKASGIPVQLGVDHDSHALASFRRNVKASGLLADLTTLDPASLVAAIDRDRPLLLTGGPPCQLFSTLHQKRSPRSPAIAAYVRLVRSIRPDYLVLENVPNIVRSPQWTGLLNSLSACGYHLWAGIVDMRSLGLPQKRRRLVLIGSRQGLLVPRWSPRPEVSVRMAIGHLPSQDPEIPNHEFMTLSASNLARIRKLRKDGQRSRVSGPFPDAYSRMAWDEPAPTITTRAISFSNGRFGHPHFDRALSVREAALLQGFPADFVFEGTLWQAARQVGNAVPPVLGRLLGRLVRRHVAGSYVIPSTASRTAKEILRRSPQRR